MLNERLKQQMDFIIEIDKVKSIFRQTYVTDGSRHENDAEHSWHLAMMAIIFADYVEKPLDITKVLKMVLVHDLVEIYAGDTFAFDEKGNEDKAEREQASATKLFALLPSEQGQELRILWEEFEACTSKEAKYSSMLDRMQPLLLNYITGGGSWKKYHITAAQVYLRNKITLKEGPLPLRELVQYIIDECIEKGYLLP